MNTCLIVMSIVWWPTLSYRIVSCALLFALLFSYRISDGDLLVIDYAHAYLPTASPSPSPVPSPVPTALPSTAAPSSTSLSVTAIQNEGLACMAMAASLPGLQTLSGECIRC